jgi:hypothetical protein
MNPMPLEIQITVSPDGYRRVAEIWSAGSRVCEINDDSGDVVVEIYPDLSGRPWRLDLAEFLNALSQAGHLVLNK